MDLRDHHTTLRAQRRALIETLRQGARPRAAQSGTRSEAAQRQLRVLERALKRIESGTFGLCMACGAQISAERLHQYPSTALCASCKGEG